MVGDAHSLAHAVIKNPQREGAEAEATDVDSRPPTELNSNVGPRKLSVGFLILRH